MRVDVHGLPRGDPPADEEYGHRPNVERAEFASLPGTVELFGRLDPGSKADLSESNRVRVYVNDQAFLDDDRQPTTVWAATLEDESDADIYVTIQPTLEDATNVFRAIVADRFEDLFCEVAHGPEGSCACDTPSIDEPRMIARLALPAAEHGTLTTYPQPTCVCGAWLRLPGDDGHYPTVGEHIDAITAQQ